MKTLLYLVLLLLPVEGLMAQQDGMLDTARTYFEEVKQITATPAAMLWKQQLAGPVLLVNPVTRKVYANTPDTAGILVLHEGIYTGQLPVTVNIANTAAAWAGVRWTMLLLPLPAGKDERMNLLVHELFHRIQHTIGYPVESPVCDHLDTKNGRILFRLELEALKAALHKPVDKRGHDLQQALLFRQYRYRLFSGAKEKEEALELNEGLAEFTGVYVSGIARHDTTYLPGLVDGATQHHPSFSRSSAYLTGPLYGMLLTDKKEHWQEDLRNVRSFPGLLAQVYGLTIPPRPNDSIPTKEKQYHADNIRKEEESRETERLNKVKIYAGKLVNGPLLEITLTRSMGFSFNPNTVFPMEPYGTVYPGIIMTDEWGRLVVTDAVLMKDWRIIYLPVTAEPVMATLIKGAGWELTPAKGWKIVAGNRGGDYKLIKE